MPELERPDGVSINYDVRGEGPLVALASYWSWSPGVFADFLAELERDHSVLTYDLRGNGQSTRQGPYDLETDCGDLEALLEAEGGADLLLAVADSANRGARVAARRPDLAGALVCLGAAPFPRSAFAGGEGMIASDTVVDAFVEMLSRDYRGALRAMLTATNEQMSEGELGERVGTQLSYSPQEAAVARFAEWVAGEPQEDARALGSRLWIITSRDGIAGAWLPHPDEFDEVMAKLVPEAQVVYMKGAVSEPGRAAALVREITASR